MSGSLQPQALSKGRLLVCGGFEYIAKDPVTGEEKIKKVFFPIPNAQIPFNSEDGISWAIWGKRKGEFPEIDVPQTGWARLDSLAAGKWNHYNPSKVRIPALRWMEKDANRESHWFDMEQGSCLLGVKIDTADKSFVYIVTKEAKGEQAEVHSRMPLVVKA